MFFQNFKYTLKALLRNRGLVFWTLAFPLIMALFFNIKGTSWNSTDIIGTLPSQENAHHIGHLYFNG